MSEPNDAVMDQGQDASADYQNPLQGLTLPEMYQFLLSGDRGTPRWPEERLQKGYTGTAGVDLLRRAVQFIDMIEKDGGLPPGWKGLDYGCGWGRMASVLLTKAPPEQLDLCDAWPQTLRIISGLGYRNRIFPVPELLGSNDIPPESYDLVLSFSVFTHLSPAAFQRNIPVLTASLRPGGRFYFTVRHDEFIEHKYAAKAVEYRETLAHDGVLFVDSGGDLGSDKVFGDTVVSPDYMSALPGAGSSIRYLGLPHSLQHVYVIEKT